MSEQEEIRVLTGKKKGNRYDYIFFDQLLRGAVGTGAVGAIYSWRLAQSCKVTAVCRSNYEVVKRNGFQIDSVKFGQGTFRPHHGKVSFKSCKGLDSLANGWLSVVVRHVSEANEHGPFDFVMVTLKALPDVYNVGEIIAPAVTEGRTAIVLVQNGFGKFSSPWQTNFWSSLTFYRRNWRAHCTEVPKEPADICGCLYWYVSNCTGTYQDGCCRIPACGHI